MISNLTSEAVASAGVASFLAAIRWAGCRRTRWMKCFSLKSGIRATTMTSSTANSSGSPASSSGWCTRPGAGSASRSTGWCANDRSRGCWKKKFVGSSLKQQLIWLFFNSYDTGVQFFNTSLSHRTLKNLKTYQECNWLAQTILIRFYRILITGPD